MRRALLCAIALPVLAATSVAVGLYFAYLGLTDMLGWVRGLPDTSTRSFFGRV